MKTTDALQRFYKHCQDKGLSPVSVKNYQFYLRHFAEELPELPTDTDTIEAFLRKRHEGPGHRSDVFKKIQAFYSYLQKVEGIPSPVPSKGKVGRPPKHGNGASPDSGVTIPFVMNPPDKLVGGGHRTIEVHVFIHVQAGAGIHPAS